MSPASPDATPRGALARGPALLRQFLAVPFLPQTYLNLLYLALAFPLGLFYFLFVSVGVSFGLGLAIVVVGVPILALVIAGVLGLAGLERRVTTFLLGVDIAQPTAVDGDGVWEQAKTVVADGGTWKAAVYLPTKLLFGVVSFAVVTTTLTTGVSLLLVPLYYSQPGLYVGVVTDRPMEFTPALHLGWNRLLVGFETVFQVQSWQVTTLPEALTVAAVGVFVLLLGLNVLNLLARLSGWYAELMLGDTYDVVGAVV